MTSLTPLHRTPPIAPRPSVGVSREPLARLHQPAYGRRAARLSHLAAAAIVAVAGLLPPSARAADPKAQACSPADIAAAVERAGEELRRFNAENTPKLQAKLRALKAARGWSDADYERRSIDLLHDNRIATYDRRASDILARIDALGVTSASTTTATATECAKVGQLQAATRELLATMKAKADYTQARLDTQIAAATPPPAPTAPARVTPPPAAPPRQAKEPPKDWKSATSTAPIPAERGSPPQSPVSEPAAPAPSAPSPAWPEQGPPPQAGYTIDEIREVSRGFFGTISTELASVIEHAFRKSGRPTAYILGTEGGGAFLAGLRYGEGTLYLRSGGSQKIYWQGPSLGSDIGASGSRTMFLIYRADTPDRLYRRFTGIDGSAYFVGGVGLTFLTDGTVLMAPIRSGVGFRLGASIGYIRFSPTPTWNPF